MKIRDLREFIDGIPNDYEVKLAFMDGEKYDYFLIPFNTYNIALDNVNKEIIFEGDFTK